MQWVIDIIKAWTQVRGNLPASFVKHGDRDTYDFSKADFIRDHDWYELDLSGIVPEGATAVLISIRMSSADLPALFKLRPAGYTGEKPYWFANCQVAGLTAVAVGTVGLSADRKIEYAATVSDWSTLWLAVKGWWF